MIELHPLCELKTVLCTTVGTIALRLPMCNRFSHAPPQAVPQLVYSINTRTDVPRFNN